MIRIDKALLERYIKGLADERERILIEELFADGQNNPELKHLLEQDWNESAEFSADQYQKLDHILDNIHKSGIPAKMPKRRNLIRKIYQFYYKSAAIILPPLVIAGLILFQSIKEREITAETTSSTIYAPKGSRTSFTLPDGTKGMLNSGSSLAYSMPFANNRKIELQGEAWFDVKHDKKHPFNIKVGSAEVKVLGTSFNVNAYPNEDYIEIVLENGKLKYVDSRYHQDVNIRPSQRLIARSGKIDTSFTDPVKFHSWTEGKLVFKGDSMGEVARRIERWYNIEVILTDKELRKYSYRGTFQDDSPEDIFRFLSMTSPIKYKIEPARLQPDGTITKKKVTVFIK